MYAILLLCLLLRAETTMTAAAAACRLFVTAVLPGLFPYMVISLMLASRVKRLRPGLVQVLGWGGGSPAGARLIPLCQGVTRRDQVRLAVSCATMSPMFLLGTVGGWLQSSWAGAVCLISVIAGGWLAGEIARLCSRREPAGPLQAGAGGSLEALSFGSAVEQSARTMLLVCGTMVMLRVFAALAAEILPNGLILPVTTLLEVTTGTSAIATLPLPLALRAALIAGACGFGGMAILLQNRAVLGADFMPLGLQVAFQALHGLFSFLVALGLMLLIG